MPRYQYEGEMGGSPIEHIRIGSITEDQPDHIEVSYDEIKVDNPQVKPFDGNVTLQRNKFPGGSSFKFQAGFLNF